ncbi:MAG: hypothetical protein O2992_05340 [Gemmatimonadetes bacterium]|nr:hypothetical protein [Gemmatimonadota bacterium]
MMLRGGLRSKPDLQNTPTDEREYVVLWLALRNWRPVTSDMSSSTLKTARYIRAWITGRADVIEAEITLNRDGLSVPATLLRPRGTKEPLPAWIVMHGITRPGRTHAQLIRFTRALAATGAAVIVPDVPEWRHMNVAPGLTGRTIRACIDALQSMSDVRAEPYGLVGFSFGAPHTIVAMSDPTISEHVGTTIGFGGYCDLERTIQFMFTGRHEYGGVSYVQRPDPYGRWIVGANYLIDVPGYEDAHDVARELRALASLAGDTGAVAWDPIYDPAKREARTRIADERWALFDLIAPPADSDPEPIAGARLASQLAEAGERVEPTMAVGPALRRVTQSVHIVHGYRDHLIPFTEGLRLKETLLPNPGSYATVTRLFGHSAQEPFPSPARAAREIPIFLRAMARALGAL